MNLSDLPSFLSSIGAKFSLSFNPKHKWHCMLSEADYDWDRNRRTRRFRYGQGWGDRPETAIDSALRAFNADYVPQPPLQQRPKAKPGVTLSLEDLDLS